MFQKIQRYLEQDNTIKKYVSYTLDLEEDHAGYLYDYYEGIEYLEELIQLAKEKEIYISFFVQAKMIEKFPEKIELIRNNHFEIHLHSYSHSLRKSKDRIEIREEIEKSKEIYQDFFGKNPKGYRFPLGVLREEEYLILKELDFKFDSSIFPTIRPGYFNNLNKPLTPYEVGGIIEIPFSMISKIIRVPIALSYIKLFYPLHFLKKYHFSPLVFDFHLHDLFELSSTKKLTIIKRLPYIRKSKDGLVIFLNFYEKLKKEDYESINISKIYKKIKADNL